MSATWQASADALVRDLREVFGKRLLSVAVYGEALEDREHATLNSLGLVESLSQEDLNACARLTPQWRRSGIDTPLLLPETEFRRSLDAFPLEYADILARHAHVFGRNPFDGVRIESEDVRRACEQQIKSHLLHLREGYIEAGGEPFAVAQLVAASAPALGGILRSVARLHGTTTTTRKDMALEGARRAGLSDGLVAQILSADGSGAAARSLDGARIFPDYLTAIEQLAHAVDTWRT